MMALLFGYQWYIAPSEEDIAAWKPNRKRKQPPKTAAPPNLTRNV